MEVKDILLDLFTILDYKLDILKLQLRVFFYFVDKFFFAIFIILLDKLFGFLFVYLHVKSNF
jgi:hypothetical protein